MHTYSTASEIVKRTHSLILRQIRRNTFSRNVLNVPCLGYSVYTTARTCLPVIERYTARFLLTIVRNFADGSEKGNRKLLILSRVARAATP